MTTQDILIANTLAKCHLVFLFVQNMSAVVTICMPGYDSCLSKIFAHPGKMYLEFNGPLSGGTSLKNNFFRGARGWVLALRDKTQPRDARKKLFFKELLTVTRDIGRGSTPTCAVTPLTVCGYTPCLNLT